MTGSTGLSYILIVEDEPLIALHLQQMLTELGFHDVRSAPDLPRGVVAVQSARPGLAILDVDLGGVPVFPLAEILRAAGVPILFTSGRAHEDLPADWIDLPYAAKPITKPLLAAAIRVVGLLPEEAALPNPSSVPGPVRPR